MAGEGTQFSNPEFQVAALGLGGYVLSSRYDIQITNFGTALRTAISNRMDDTNTFIGLLNYRTTAISLPQIALASAPAKIFGTDYEVPYQRNFDGDISLTIIADKSNAIRNVFEDMIVGIQNTRTGHWNFRDEYAFDMRIGHLPRKDYVASSYFIRECFPKTIRSGAGLQATDNELHTFVVTLSYRDYHTDFDVGLSGKATHMSSVGLQGPDDLELLNKPDRQLPVPVQESGIDFPDIVTPPIPPTDAFA